MAGDGAWCKPFPKSSPAPLGERQRHEADARADADARRDIAGPMRARVDAGVAHDERGEKDEPAEAKEHRRDEGDGGGVRGVVRGKRAAFLLGGVTEGDFRFHREEEPLPRRALEVELPDAQLALVRAEAGDIDDPAYSREVEREMEDGMRTAATAAQAPRDLFSEEDAGDAADRDP